MAQQAIVTPRPMPAARPRKAPAKQAAAATKDSTRREARKVTSTTKREVEQVKGAAVGSGKVVARTAKQDVRELAGTVRSQAEQVKGELAGQARGMLAETQGQLQAQADVQASRLAGALFQVGSQAVALSEGRPEQAGPLVDYAEQAVVPALAAMKPRAANTPMPASSSKPELAKPTTSPEPVMSLRRPT